MMELRIRCVEKARDFVTLAPMWGRLTEQSGQLSPFLSYDWFWCCWHGVWPHRRPEILVIEEAREPIAIVPLMHWKQWVRGMPVRYVGFLEVPHTPWVDMISVAEPDSLVEAVLDHLASRSDWDVAWLQKLPSSSPTLKALEGVLPGRLSWRHDGCAFSPYLAIEGDWDSFLKTQHSSGRDHHQKPPVPLPHSCGGCIEQYHTMDLQGSLLREALRFKNRSSQGNRCLDDIPMPRAWEFFCELSRRAAKNGWLSLWSYKADGQLVALEYQLCAHGEVQVLWTEFNQAYGAGLAGSELQRAILRSLFDEAGVYEYRQTPRHQEAHPSWVTGCHKAVHLKVYRSGLYPRVLQRVLTSSSLGKNQEPKHE